GNPDRPQAASDLIAVPVELAVGQVRITDASRPVSPRGDDHGQRVGLPAGHRAQVAGDVRRLGESGRSTQPTGSRIRGWAMRKDRTRPLIESRSSSKTRCPARGKRWTLAWGNR